MNVSPAIEAKGHKSSIANGHGLTVGDLDLIITYGQQLRSLGKTLLPPVAAGYAALSAAANVQLGIYLEAEEGHRSGGSSH